MQKTRLKRAGLGQTGLEITRVGHSAVDGAIVGFRRPGQVDAILAAASLELSRDDLAAIGGSA